MGQFVKGDSDDRQWSSRRSEATTSSCARSLDAAGYVSGGLNQSSRIRPNRLFAADAGIIVYRAGRVSAEKLNEAVDRLIAIIRQT